VATFSAYFDASGNKRMSVLTVAGFVSRTSKWGRFDEEWAAILSRENVSAMHMTDFVSSQREFASWRGQTDRRRRFVSDLCQCIKRNTNKGFAKSVILSEYNEVNTEFMLGEVVGQPFTICAYACLGALEKWAVRRGIKKGSMLIAAEQGDEDEGELVRVARSDGFEVALMRKADAAAFQAADLVAWKSRTAIHEGTSMPPESEEDAERIVGSLAPISAIVQDNRGFDADALRRLCACNGIPRRPTGPSLGPG
jgi:hypothetical protein